jgi:hypothetical protein
VVDQLVGHDGGHDLAAQPVVLDLGGEPRAQGGWEVADQLGGQVGIVGDVAVEQPPLRGHLGVGEEHGELGGGEPFAVGLALGVVLAGG